MPDRSDADPDPCPQPEHHTVRALLAQALSLDDAQALDQWQRQLEPLHLAGGETLMVQGEPGEALYLIVGGRLRA